MGVVFKLNPEPTFRATVQIPVPGAEDMPLEVEFRHKTRDALRQYLDGLADSTDEDALQAILVGWHNCETAFSREALETLLQNYPAAARAILARYAVEVSGARRGN